MATRKPELFAGSLIALGIGYVIAVAALTTWSARKVRQLVAELDAGRLNERRAPAYEYRSRLHLLGLPFLHIRFGGGMAAQRKPVKAWIAIGDCAVGVLFAFGGLAVAPLSVGGCAIGLLPFGGFALGALALGGFSLGIWSFGGMAFGWQAYGGCAVAWQAALGGTAIAREYALGGIAQAVEANNSAAATFARSQPFFQKATIVIRYLAWLHLIWVVPILFWWRRVRKARKQVVGA